jgi:hypothetical protein
MSMTWMKTEGVSRSLNFVKFELNVQAEADKAVGQKLIE